MSLCWCHLRSDYIKGKGLPVTCQEGTEGEEKYDCTHSDLDGRVGWVFNASTRPPYPRDNSPSPHTAGG